MPKPIRVSIVVTVLNEEKTIEKLLFAIKKQTLQPTEVVIADGGSIDTTIEKIEAWKKKNQPLFSVKVLSENGNRSIGRNAAINAAKNSWIAITDAGCVPHPDWLEQLVEKAQTASADKAVVIAGYYDAHPSTPLEEAIVPYALVMPDRVNPESFLPATRSMLLEKRAWELVGGFDPTLSDNEDYPFARSLAAHPEITVVFAGAAKVTWQPRSTLITATIMMFRFARGDAKAGILRPKVAVLFARYVALLLLLWMGVLVSVRLTAAGFSLLSAAYFSWAIAKNKKYVPHGWYWLPVLQLSADAAVLAGSGAGWLQQISSKKPSAPS